MRRSLARNLMADADGDGERGGDVIDAAPEGVPHLRQLQAVAALDGLVDDGSGQGAVGAEELGVAAGADRVCESGRELRSSDRRSRQQRLTH
jgi:hypothetical protein